MSDPRTLTEALAQFGSYPEDHPQTVAELVSAEPDTLSHPLAWFLRKQAIEATRSSERHYVNGPQDALRLLRNGYVLHPWEGSWVSYALTGDRQVALVPHDKGGVRTLRKATRLIPKADDLPDLPHGATRGGKKAAWLVIYGGTPEVLSKPHVATGLATLRRRVPTADIVFYTCDAAAGTPPTLWSVTAGCGVTETGGPGGTQVPFPDLQALAEVRNA